MWEKREREEGETERGGRDRERRERETERDEWRTKENLKGWREERKMGIKKNKGKEASRKRSE